MRKLIVHNFVTVDGFYEGKDETRTLAGLFDYFHDDYNGDQNFDLYSLERLLTADTLLLSGRTSYMGNKDYWLGVPNNPNATPVRLEIVALQFAEVAHQQQTDGLLDEKWQGRDDQPTSFSYGTTIVHVITHSAHHRAQLMYMLKCLGVPDVIMGDALAW
jgi:DinB family